MGACFSTQSADAKPPAIVVSADGQLRQYSLPVTASQVLRYESSSSGSVFLCDSDSLCFDEFIPPLAGDLELDSDQIYFVLPEIKLRYRLVASDMAAMAVKASIALENINRQPKRLSKARISPALVAEHPQANYQIQNKVFFNSPVGAVSRSGSTRKMQRLMSSRRAKLAVRSFRIKLSTIYEGSALHTD